MKDDEGREPFELPKNYFSVQKNVLKLIGVPFITKRTLFFKIYGPLPIIILSSFAVSSFGHAFCPPIDVNEISTNIFFGTGVAMGTVKHLIIYTNRLKLREIMDTIENDPYLYNFKYRDTDDTVSIQRCIEFTRKICFVGESIAFVSVLLNIVATLFMKAEDGSLSLPFGRMSFLQNHTNYVIVFLFESAALIAAVFAHMTCDIVYSTIVAHLCVQLQILKKFIRKIDLIVWSIIEKGESLKKLAKKVSEFDPTHLKWEYLQMMLKEAVNYHLTILEITEKIDKLFSMTMLAEFFAMSICIIFILYHASLYPLSDIRAIKDFAILITAATPVALMSYWGNEVTIESQAISAACYEMNFIGTDIRFQKDLVMIMQRSQRPVVLTIGKFATLSLMTLVSFFRACYSYYMVLHKSNSK